MPTHKFNTTGDELHGLLDCEWNPSLPFDPPEGCLAYRIRIRAANFIDVILRFSDRTERRCVIRQAGRQMPGGLIACNHRG